MRTAAGMAPPPARCSTERSSAVTPPASSSAPPTSSGSGRAARDSIICVATRAKASTPRGTLMEKIERQPKVTVRPAPIMGPARLATPQTPLKMPCMRARSRSENRSATTISATGIRPPAPRPCSVRARMSWLIERAAAHAPAPARKSEMATSRTRRRP